MTISTLFTKSFLQWLINTIIIIYKDFIYLREREKAQAGGWAEGEGEAGSPLSKEPDSGLIPRTPSLRQILNWATQVSPNDLLLSWVDSIS